MNCPLSSVLLFYVFPHCSVKPTWIGWTQVQDHSEAWSQHILRCLESQPREHSLLHAFTHLSVPRPENSAVDHTATPLYWEDLESCSVSRSTFCLQNNCHLLFAKDLKVYQMHSHPLSHFEEIHCAVWCWTKRQNETCDSGSSLLEKMHPSPTPSSHNQRLLFTACTRSNCI